MTWLSDQDRQDVAEMQASSQRAYDYANGKFCKVDVAVKADRLGQPTSRELPLPRLMSDRDAIEYANSIGHTAVRGFRDDKGAYYRYDRGFY